jgi:hypothetical protein
MKKVLIKFGKAISPYKVGDICGKPEEEAEKYVAGGFAEYYKTETKEVEAPPVDKKIKKPRVKK